MTACRRASFAILLCAGVLPCAAGDFRLLSESDTQVLFEVHVPRPVLEQVGGYVRVTIPDYAASGDPGEPALPMIDHLVAVPPGAVAVATMLESDEQLLGRGRILPQPERWFELPEGEDPLPVPRSEYREDPSIYQSVSIYPPVGAEAQAVRGWRYLRIAPIEIYPVRYDPEREELYWSSRMIVRVDFVQRSSAAAEGLPYLRAEPRWEPLYRRRIVNYGSGKQYKRAFPAPSVRRALRAGEEAEFEVRLQVERSAVYRVAFDDLGVRSDPIAWDDLLLEVRDYDETAPEERFIEWAIAYLPEGDGDAWFEEGEALIFYGEDAWDFFDYTPGEKRYVRHNVYWLVHAAGAGGPRMETIPGWYGEDLERVALYTRTIHFEENLYYMPIMAAYERPMSLAGQTAFSSDHYNWTNPEPMVGTEAQRIKVVTLDFPKTLSVQALRVRLQGQQVLKGSPSHAHYPRLWLSRSADPFDTTWAFPGNPYRVRAADSLTVEITDEFMAAQGWNLRTGHNYLKIYLPTEGDGIDNRLGDGIGIDWAQVDFTGTFVLRHGAVLAPLEGLTGRQELRIYEISAGEAQAAAEFYVFDLTDRRRPRHVALADSLFEPNAWSSGKWDCRLQFDCAGGSPAAWICAIEGAAITDLPADAIRVRHRIDLTEFSGEDYVAIYPRRFAPLLEPLWNHREEQGHVVLRAPIEEVFNAYSGGRRHVFAIKRMLRHMWAQSEAPPDYLLLIGDASHDIASYSIANEDALSDSNYVPVMTVPGHVYVNGSYGIIACDHWFVDNLRGAWDEVMTFIPDMYVGRFPCATEEEVEVFVTKVLGYEREDLGAHWRTRVVMHSDDTFSKSYSTAGGTGTYVRRANEGYFLDLTRESAAYITGDTIFAHYDVDSVFQATIMDSVPELGRCQLDPSDSTRCRRDAAGQVVLIDMYTAIDDLPSIQYGGGEFRDHLLQSLNQGALIWAYQGHSARTLLAHEYVFQQRMGIQDVPRLTNVARPFIFMGFACHLHDYAHELEGERIRSDAMPEALLTCCPGEPKGAVASFASTDYEIISHKMQAHTFKRMFSVPPRDENGHSRWRLGELTTEAKVWLASSNAERITYLLMGDPALRVGLAPPLVTVTLNDEPWDPAVMSTYLSQREDDSLTVQVAIHDESHVLAPEVTDYFGVAGPDQLHQQLPPGDDRRTLFEYRTQVQPRPYALSIRTRDAAAPASMAREIAIDLPTSAVIAARRDGARAPLAEGEALRDTTGISVMVRTVTHLAPEGVDLRAGGISLPLVGRECAAPPGESRVHTLDYGSLEALDVGAQTLAVWVMQPDGEPHLLASLEIDLRRDDLPLTFVGGQSPWIPSPFSTETTLVYRLSSAAGRVRLRIFTSSGREILTRDRLGTERGANYFRWDGRDDDGDSVANGLYFYELCAWDLRGQIAGRILEKLVRLR